jgi:hypothetical protein
MRILLLLLLVDPGKVTLKTTAAMFVEMLEQLVITRRSLSPKAEVIQQSADYPGSNYPWSQIVSNMPIGKQKNQTKITKECLVFLCMFCNVNTYVSVYKYV